LSFPIEPEFCAPYQKRSLILKGRQTKRIPFDVEELNEIHAVRMYARGVVLPQQIRRFLVNTVLLDGQEIPIIKQAPLPFAPVLSDVFFRCDLPVIVDWGKPSESFEIEVENLYTDKIEATIVLYGDPKP